MSIDSVIDDLPQTIIEIEEDGKGRPVDRYYLIFRGEKLLLGPTEYAVAHTLVLEELCAEKASKERQALNSEYVPMSPNSLKKALDRVRKKIEKKFLGELILTAPPPHGKARLLTKKQVKEIHKRVANPGKGIISITDEFGRHHLFIDGKEIVGPDSLTSISEVSCQLILAIAAFNQKDNSKKRNTSFKAAYREITGCEKINPNAMALVVTKLRKMLEPAGWTIPVTGGRSTDYRLVLFNPSSSAATSETHRPNRRAAHPHLPQSPVVSHSLEHIHHG